MPTLSLKPSHRAVVAYYEALKQLSLLSVAHEGAIKNAFQELLKECGKRCGHTLVTEWEIRRPKGHPLRVDGALVDDYRLAHGYWEAKDSDDHLPKEVRAKLQLGYPRDNILFQAPDRAILWQGGEQVIDEDIRRPEALVDVLKAFFEYEPPSLGQWESAVAEFQSRVAELARALVGLIAKERSENLSFIKAFAAFSALCRHAVNPNLSDAAVEEMLIQHLLTERIFRKVFDNPDFTRRNVIAVEIEKVVDALTSRAFSREGFLRELDRFYVAIETTAGSITDYAEKQRFLNSVYEKFFQGFCVKVADTHGIVYTPQPIVSFMVRSVDALLHDEFGTSLGQRDVHILDPFVGTGNFIVHVMEAMPKSALPAKYASELHCNEVMLLPYYIAAMNIEHAYFERCGEYRPFTGVCLADTFELSETGQLPLITYENTARVARQCKAPIFVCIGNPPYNAWQLDENDRNRNRRYPTLEKRLAETYVGDSMATLRNALADPYVKAIRWAADRIGEEGIVAFVTNSNFIDGLAFDGMRKHLAQDFDDIYLLDLGGNVRKNPKLSGTTHNVFGIQVGVAVSFLVRKKLAGAHRGSRRATIHYARLDEYWRRQEKYDFLDSKKSYREVKWERLKPDKRNLWLTRGLSGDFERFVPLGIKRRDRAEDVPVEAIFETFCNGAKTNNDAYVYSFDKKKLLARAFAMVEAFNDEKARYRRKKKPADLDGFLRVDVKVLKWIRKTKQHLRRGTHLGVDKAKFRPALYRPFCKQWLLFDPVFCEDLYQLPKFFPDRLGRSPKENRAILAKVGAEVPFYALAIRDIPDLQPQTGSQVFPFFTFAEDGTRQRESITDWALGQFRTRYRDKSIEKWDIFYYVYAVLHHPEYRERYAANLKRELARVPLAPDFRGFATAGKRLDELHADYEQQPEYPLGRVESPGHPLNWRVERMRLSRDRTSIVYNDFLTLTGIPEEALAYRLGNRSALEWVIEQYRVSTDSRSGITNDPNQLDDPEAIVRLIGKVVTVSVETMRVVAGLPDLGVGERP